MSPQTARSERAPAPVSANSEWNVFLVSKADALRKAKSARRRRFAMFIIIAFLVLAAAPISEYASERYPNITLSAAFEGSKAYIREVPRIVKALFGAGGGGSFGDSESSSALADAGDANPSFSVASLRSNAAILANLGTGSILLKKSADIRIYPASLTKIMTVLIAIERLDTLPEFIVMDAELLESLIEANSTMAGFLPGEEVRTVDLIYGSLLLSGGECSVSLARAIAGTEEDFAAVMNARADELAMLDTHFTNSTGLHDPEHYSTARDIAKLLLYALENEEFEKIFTTEEYITFPSDMHGDGMMLTNNIFARIRTLEFDGGRILGGKTGWTGEAGQCLASLAEKNGNRYILVTTGNGIEPNGMAYNFEDALNVYENAILSH